MRILITGAAGMLGAAVTERLGPRHQVIALSRHELDVTDAAAVWTTFRRERPEVVIHLAALTDVDRCQREPELARQVNAAATQSVAAACRQVDTTLIFVSSIAVFDGEKETPYIETDTPNPINEYGRTKWLAEQHVAATTTTDEGPKTKDEGPRTNLHHVSRFTFHDATKDRGRAYIVRSGWLFGGGRLDKKFVQLILRLAQEKAVIPVVDDKIGSPTYVNDLAAGLERLLRESPPSGTYHLVNSGPPVSRYDLAVKIKEMAGFTAELQPVSSDYFPTLAPRPTMEAAASLHCAGWLRPWEEALAEYLDEGRR